VNVATAVGHSVVEIQSELMSTVVDLQVAKREVSLQGSVNPLMLTVDARLL
jgi:hypothetical protein